MNVEQQVESVLKNDAGVTAVVAGRIYPVLMPQNIALPAITYQRIATTPENGLAGHLGIDQVRMQVDSWSTKYSEVKDAAAAVRAALALTPLFALCIMELDDYEPATQTYRVIQDYQIWN